MISISLSFSYDSLNLTLSCMAWTELVNLTQFSERKYPVWTEPGK